MVVMLSVLCLPHSALGKVYIDIDSPAFQKFPIAIVGFQENKSTGLSGRAVKLVFRYPGEVSGDDGIL